MRKIFGARIGIWILVLVPIIGINFLTWMGSGFNPIELWLGFIGTLIGIIVGLALMAVIAWHLESDINE